MKFQSSNSIGSQILTSSIYLFWNIAMQNTRESTILFFPFRPD
uniref:Uncharacterized protein n=1 Tax=Arundo donax TaxID=35708 RepID=A0A0A8YVW0_ARUDO